MIMIGRCGGGRCAAEAVDFVRECTGSARNDNYNDGLRQVASMTRGTSVSFRYMLGFVRITNYKEAQMSERRPRFIRCASCNKKVTVAEAGRIPVYCSNACRQLAFARNARGTKVSAEDQQRLLMWELLQDAAVVPADMPPPPKRRPERE